LEPTWFDAVSLYYNYIVSNIINRKFFNQRIELFKIIKENRFASLLFQISLNYIYFLIVLVA